MINKEKFLNMEKTEVIKLIPVEKDNEMTVFKYSNENGSETSMISTGHFSAELVRSSGEVIPLQINITANTLITKDLKNGYYLICKVHDSNNIQCQAIVSDRYWDNLSHIKTINQRVKSVKFLMTQSKTIRDEILSRLENGKHFPVIEEIENLRCVNEYEPLFDILKPLYDSQQQSDIMGLINIAKKNFGATSSDARSKVQNILSISTSSKKKINKSYEEIIDKLNKSYYFKDQKVPRMIADIIIDTKYNNGSAPNILLVGPSGTGKTSLMELIAEILEIPAHMISVGCVSTKDDLIATSSFFSGSSWGEMSKPYINSSTTNVLIGLDELGDVVSSHAQSGSIASVLNDPLGDKRQLKDNWLTVYLDTKNTFFIATANNTDNIPESLINRFTVIEVEPYTDEEKLQIGRNYVIPSLLKERNIDDNSIKFEDEAIMHIIKNYCTDSGARDMNKSINSVIRHCLSILDMNKSEHVTVTTETVDKVLSDYVNVDNLLLFYRQHLSYYSDEKIKEIEKTIHSIRCNAEPEQKEKYKEKLFCLVKAIPVGDSFNEFNHKDFVKKLDSTHFGMKKIKTQIADALNAMQISNGTVSGTVIGLEGGYGIGKTSLARSVANALDAEFIEINCNGISDISTISGHSFTYTSAKPGLLVSKAANAGTTKLVVLFNEIGLMGTHDGIRAQSAVMDILDNKNEFFDVFCGQKFDFSKAIIICTWNNVGDNYMLPSIMDRMNVVHLEGYSDTEKQEIAKSYIIPKILDECNPKVKFNDEAVTEIIHNYTFGCGVRDIEKAVKKIVYSVCGETTSKKAKHMVTVETVHKVLGEPKITRGNYPTSMIRPGMTKSLAVSGNNEGVLFCTDTVLIPDETSLIVTGLCGQDIQETIKKAITYVKCTYPDKLKNVGIHVDQSEGSVEKSGSSGGVAVLISLLSACFDTIVDQESAFTGEINLRGDIFPVGGIKPKILAAKRNGCKRVFIPWQNRNDEFLTASNDIGIEVIPVKHISEVIIKVLPLIPCSNK